MSGARGAPGRATAGAVYVELLIAFLPVFFMFLSIVQYGLLVMSRLVVEHAAVCAARAAAVVVAEPPEPGALDAGSKRADVEAAAYLVLAPLVQHGYVTAVHVRYPDEQGNTARERTSFSPRPAMAHFDATMDDVDWVRVRVDAVVRCRIAPVNAFLCGPLPGWLSASTVPDAALTRTLSAEASFPYQGARYQMTEK